MKQRWIYPANGADPYPADQRPEHELGGLVVIGDSHYDIGDPRFHSRATHREYMRANGLSLVDDFKGEWERAAERRADFFTRSSDPQRAHDIARAVEMVRRGHVPRRSE